MIPSPPSPRYAPRNEVIAHYEALRQQALGRPCAIPRGQGLALLMRGGMSGWMQAWAQCVVAVAPPKEPLGDDAIFPIELHREVTLILAGIVLHGCQEALA